MASLDADDIYELQLEVRSARYNRGCQCGTGASMPGTCPGPTNCPYSDYDQGEEDE